eukprot:771778-Prorocentrum_minimum.AAC.1
MSYMYRPRRCLARRFFPPRSQARAAAEQLVERGEARRAKGARPRQGASSGNPAAGPEGGPGGGGAGGAGAFGRTGVEVVVHTGDTPYDRSRAPTRPPSGNPVGQPRPLSGNPAGGRIPAARPSEQPRPSSPLRPRAAAAAAAAATTGPGPAAGMSSNGSNGNGVAAQDAEDGDIAGLMRNALRGAA